MSPYSPLKSIAVLASALLLAACETAVPVSEGAAVVLPSSAPETVTNYAKVAPNVAVSGRLDTEGLSAVKALGVRRVIDIRRPSEPGVADSELAANALSLPWENIPFASDPEGLDAFLAALTEALEEEDALYPVVIACGSANRAAAAWTLYLIQGGTAPEEAIEVGRAAGMTSTEAIVRAYLAR